MFIDEIPVAHCRECGQALPKPAAIELAMIPADQTVDEFSQDRIVFSIFVCSRCVLLYDPEW